RRHEEHEETRRKAVLSRAQREIAEDNEPTRHKGCAGKLTEVSKFPRSIWLLDFFVFLRVLCVFVMSSKRSNSETNETKSPLR
ncbi:MAG: hypothetical protein ABI771_14185, partial [Betaproteobacteria bacterium]